MILLLTFLGCLGIFVSELFLSWDASFQIYESIKYRSDGVMPLRWIMFFLKAPMNLYLALFDVVNVSIATTLFGLTYSFIPFFILLLLYFVTKENKALFSVGATGVLLPTLFFQYHPLAEHLIAIQLFWVLLCYNAFEKEPDHRFSFLLSGVLFFTHPVSSFLFLFWSLFNFLLFFKYKEKKIYLRQGGAFLLFSIIRYYLIYNGKSDENAASMQTINELMTALMAMGSNILLMYFAFPFFVLLSVISRLKKSQSLSLFFLIIASLFFVVFPLIYPQGIILPAAARYFQFVVQFPFYCLFFYYFIYSPFKFEKESQLVLIAPIVVFTLLISFLGFWRKDKMDRVVEHYKKENITCVEAQKVIFPITWEHFATPFEFIMHQKTLSPTFIVLPNENSCEDFKKDPKGGIKTFGPYTEDIASVIDLKGIR